VPAQQPPSNPPSRRRPVPQQTPPARRTRVAGLRRPEGPSARPEPRTPEVSETPDAEVTQVIPVVPAEPEPVVDAVPAEVEQPKPPRRRPRPAPAPRDEPVDALPDDSDADGSDSDGSDSEAGPQRSRMTVPFVLAVVAVLIGGLAAWFGVEWSHVRGGASASNTALTDSATTSEVTGQLTSAVNTIFSYDYTNMAKTEKAVPQLLTGNALCQYNQLFKVVQQQAPAEKLVLTTTVQTKGIQLLQGDTARMLVLVDQHDTRASTNQTSDSPSVFAVNAVRQGGTWKISAIDTLNGANPNASCKS
jgi:Mce-associated membrane protein